MYEEESCRQWSTEAWYIGIFLLYPYVVHTKPIIIPIWNYIWKLKSSIDTLSFIWAIKCMIIVYNQHGYEDDIAEEAAYWFYDSHWHYNPFGNCLALLIGYSLLLLFMFVYWFSWCYYTAFMSYLILVEILLQNILYSWALNSPWMIWSSAMAFILIGQLFQLCWSADTNNNNININGLSWYMVVVLLFW